MAFIDLFSETAGRYAAARPTYPDALFARLAALAPGTARAWDCATGNGQAAIGLARWFAHVEATDASAAQIDNAVPHERVTYAVAPAEASGLARASIDLISVAQALHWFDLPAFYSEAQQVLKPGGLLAVYGYAWFYVSPEIDALVDECLLRPITPYWAAQTRLLWHGYRTIDFPFEEIDPPKLAIHVEWSLQQMIAYYLTWSATRAHLKLHGDEFLNKALRRLEDAWGEPDRVRNVVMPLTIRLGRARDVASA